MALVSPLKKMQVPSSTLNFWPLELTHLPSKHEIFALERSTSACVMIGTLEDLLGLLLSETLERFSSVFGFAAGFAGALVQMTDPRVRLFHFICADESDTQKNVKDSSQEIFLNPFCNVISFTSPSENVTLPSEQTTRLPFSSLHVPLKA